MVGDTAPVTPRPGSAIPRRLDDLPILGGIAERALIGPIPLGNPHLVAYSAVKGGLQPLTHVMGYWLAPHGIRVNSINPGGLCNSKQGIPLSVGLAAREMSEAQRLPAPQQIHFCGAES